MKKIIRISKELHTKLKMLSVKNGKTLEVTTEEIIKKGLKEVEEK